MADNDNMLFFSAANIWEIVSKKGIGREDFKVDPCRLRKMLVLNEYQELSVSTEHVLRVDTLPPFHKDPFDRILIAQAQTEGMSLVTVDTAVLQYKEAVMAV